MWCASALIRIHSFVCNPAEFNLQSSFRHHNHLLVFVLMRARPPGCNCLIFFCHYCTLADNASLPCWQSCFVFCFFLCLTLYNRFNVISSLSWNAINKGLPTPSTESQSQHIWGQSELFCQIEESGPYFLESCCAILTPVCAPVHLIYKRSIEICMRPMMPALKIHSNREYIDSFVIELSLSFLCHRSQESLSRLMFYQTHAAALPLFLSGRYNLPNLLTLLVPLFFSCSISHFPDSTMKNMAGKTNASLQNKSTVKMSWQSAVTVGWTDKNYKYISKCLMFCFIFPND